MEKGLIHGWELSMAGLHVLLFCQTHRQSRNDLLNRFMLGAAVLFNSRMGQNVERSYSGMYTIFHHVLLVKNANVMLRRHLHQLMEPVKPNLNVVAGFAWIARVLTSSLPLSRPEPPIWSSHERLRV